uniref:Uncharacterized protein n=1 Tax=Monopterus albus TaxID=43700 RepID=A0A3Q3J282_MONAL
MNCHLNKELKNCHRHRPIKICKNKNDVKLCFPTFFPNSSLYQAASGDELEPFGRFYTPSQHVALAPSRRDVPLLDPCCGQLSAGAEVDLGIKGRQKFIDFHHVASALWVPPGFSERPQTALSADLIENKAWNSRRTPNAKKLTMNMIFFKGWLPPSSGTVDRQYTGSPTFQIHISFGNPVNQLQSRHLIQMSFLFAPPRSYEEVGWDAKLPRRLRAPRTTLEKQAHPLSECLSPRRYSSRPQLWQVSHGEQPLTSSAKAGGRSSTVYLLSSCGLLHVYTHKSGSPVVTCVAPLSRMVTTTTPNNPFLRPALPVSYTYARGDIRQT